MCYLDSLGGTMVVPANQLRQKVPVQNIDFNLLCDTETGDV